MKVQNDWGEIHWQGNQARITLIRRIEHSADRIWRMLTDEDCLPLWLAPGTLEPRVGGRVQIDFANSGTAIDSVVNAYDPSRELAYSWGDGAGPERPVHWMLEGLPEGTTNLRLTLTLPAEDPLDIACAGWDAHLEMLMAALEGINIHFPRDRFRAARAQFGNLLSQARAGYPA